MINIGVIGCGKIAQVRHLPEYAAHPEARIAGVFDLCRERAETIAETYHTKYILLIRICWRIRRLRRF